MTATNSCYCRAIHRQIALNLYYSKPSSLLCNLNHDPSRKRGYATISAENVNVEEEQPRPRPHPLKNPFPYPPHPKPTAHQIFHLRAGATQAEIKARYYELVKSHHPDSHYAAHLESDVAHHRFRAIQASYDFLRGKTISPRPNAPAPPTGKGFDPYQHEMARRRRAYYAYRNAHDDDDGQNDGRSGSAGGSAENERTIWHEDGWRERLIFGFGIVALVAGLFPTLPNTVASAFLPMSPATSPLVPPLPPSYSPSPSDDSKPAETPSPSFSFPFVDLDKGHRKAASTLSQLRAEREEYGSERRENLRKRVRDMTQEEDQKDDVATPSNSEGDNKPSESDSQ